MSTAMAIQPDGCQTAPRDAPDESSRPTISVVVPLHNEQDNVIALHSELTETMTEMGLDYEVLFVDDGSTDQTLSQLRDLCRTDPRASLLELRRNFGQTAAMSAGFDRARGDVLVTLDGDLQNDPRDIPALLAKLETSPGYDVVSGWRRNRQDTWLTRRVPSVLANWLIRRTTGVAVHDLGCTLKAYRREIVQDVRLYGEMHRFLPILAAAEGARVTELVVNHRPRMHGRTHYGTGRTFRVLMDLVTVQFLGSYVTKPLYFFGRVAFYLILAAVVLGAIAVGQKYGYLGQSHGLSLNRNVLVGVGTVLVILAAQSIVLGIVAELLVRIYHECQARPTYRLRHVYRQRRTEPADEPAPDPQHDPAETAAPADTGVGNTI